MKKIENKKLETFLSTIVEFIEFFIMYLIGYFILKVGTKEIITIFLTFIVSRFSIGKAGHYKIEEYFDNGWKRCFFWTSSLILSLCILTELGMLIALLFTIFTVFIISGWANINDMTLGWKRNELNERVLEWTKFNLNNKELMKYKEQLKQNDGKKYHIFQYYFEEGYSQNLIAKLMGIDVQRVGEEIGTMSHHIEFGIRLR